MTQHNDDPIKVGILGTGAVAQIVHLPIFTERDDAVVSALADLDEPKAEALAGRFGVERVLSNDEILADPEIDAVVICTPHSLHAEQAVAALEAGKHVLLERPAATTAEGVRKVLGAAEKAGRTLMVGMSHRYRPDVGALRSFVAGGDLGEIHSVRASSLIRYTAHVRSAWRQNPQVAGGGALMDLGVPILDMALGLVGYPRIESVTAILRRMKGDEVETSAQLLMRAEGGIVFSVEASWELFADSDRHFARVMGSEGSGQLPPLEVHRVFGGRPMEITPRQPKPRGGENRFTNAYRRLIDQFVRAVQGVVEEDLPTEQHHLMQIVEAAYRSAEEGAEVRVDS